MSDVVTFVKALADTTRWRIVCLLRGEALCVCELAAILEMPQSSVSSHLQVLHRAGLFESEKCGKWTYYRVRSSYGEVLAMLERSFPEVEEGMLERDAERAAERLAEREGSCCPGPVKLAGGGSGEELAGVSGENVSEGNLSI